MTETWPEAAHDPSAQLGCAETYSAALHWRGGARVYLPSNLLGESLAKVDWDRRLEETATAQVLLAKTSLADECCGLLGQIHPWCHELTVYRDTELIWQGPIVTVTEDADTITLSALDITAWLGRLVNTQPTIYKTATDLTTIAKDVITKNLIDAALATPAPDWPGMLPYLLATASGTKIKLNRRGVWSDTVLNIVNKMADKGFEWTTVGRRMVMRPPAPLTSGARARLTPDDLPGGIKVVRDGMDAATRVFATSQTDTEDGTTVTVAAPAATAICGRLDQIVRDSPRVDVETEAETTARRDAIKTIRDNKITAERNDANADLNVILEGPNTVAERKQAEARRKLRDTRIDQFNKDYEAQLKSSDAAIVLQERLEVIQVLGTEARAALKGRWPTPIGITVQDGAQLSPSAPLTLTELVPGERVDVVTVGYCMAVSQPMRLSKVTGTWDNDRGEAIGISLVPLSELAGVDS